MAARTANVGFTPSAAKSRRWRSQRLRDAVISVCRLRDRERLFAGWAAALRRSELVGLEVY
jgi:hypothetical protein